MTDRADESRGEIVKVRHNQVENENEKEKCGRTVPDKLTPRTTSDTEPTNDIMLENSSPTRELILLGQAEQQLREVTNKEQPITESSQKQQQQQQQQEHKSAPNEKNATPTSGGSSPANATIVANETNNSCNVNSSDNIDSERRYRPQKYCAVCGDKAIACNFNAVTCESCKAFFRRNAFKETRLKCLFENRCVIDRVTRRFCSKCRLLKCFHIGMKREWILTDEQKQIKRVKIMQNKQSRLQKTSTSPSHSEESVSPKLTTTAATNLRIASPNVVANELMAIKTENITEINTIDPNQSPTKSYNNNNNNNSEDLYSPIESTNYTRSQVFDNNEKIIKTSTRNTKFKQARGSPVVVETRDASTSCPDEFNLLSPHPRVMHHCSFASQCQYCSLRLFGSTAPSTVTNGGQQVFVDYHHHQQHLHQQLEQHHQHLPQQQQQQQQQHQHQHHPQQQPQLHIQQLEPQQWQQHQINDSSSAMHRIVPAYVASLPSSDQLEHHSMQGSHQATSDHQVNTNHQDITLHTIASSAPTLVTSCCSCHMDLNNLNPVASQFHHHHGNNGQINQPPISSNCDQTTATATTNSQISPQLHLMTPSNNSSSTLASSCSVGSVNGGANGSIGSSDSNLISWNNEFYCQPAYTEAELRLRLEKMDFLDTEKQVIVETIEATRFIFESNENHKHTCDFLNDIVTFCDAALRRLIQTVKQIKAFQMLNMDDQIVLLKTACFKILLLRSTYHFSDELDGWIDHKTGEVMTLDILKRAKKSLVYERHRDLVQKMPEPLRRDRFIMSIMAMTLLFDPTTNLKHSNSVALDNLIYLNVLRRYLISTQPDPLNKYETLVAVLQVVKACNDEYNVFFSKDFQPEQITPLLIEIFDIPTVHCDS